MTEKTETPLSPETIAILDFLAKRFSPDYEQQQAQARQAMQALYLPVAPPEKIPVRIPCVHPSGYRFDALVVPSKEFPMGRWVRIENERWPSDEELCAYDPSWGRNTRRFMPDDRGNPEPSRGYTPEVQLDLYDRIRLPILRTVGGELPVDWREDMQDKVRAIREAAAAEVLKAQKALADLPAPPLSPIAKPVAKAARAIDAK